MTPLEVFLVLLGFVYLFLRFTYLCVIFTLKQYQSTHQ